MSWEAEYDSSAVEASIRERWEEEHVYRFDAGGDGEIFSVDTPPPYVSAAHLHVGHAMSYAQADFVVRYQRMRGGRVFYPMGFDDNGLPTERFVEKKYGIKAGAVPREEFIELCLKETDAVARRYEELWRKLGLSVDWSLRYSTIDRRCQATAQLSFIDLWEKGLVERESAPILWCPECRTALAQADLDDLDRKSKLHRIPFATEDTGEPLEIATTRPELMPACVALYSHPDDERYRRLLGSRVRIPLFDHVVSLRSDESVDPEFGTGLMMVCTFGDGEDVDKWRRDQLELRIAVTEDGRLNELAGPFAGKSVTEARALIPKKLKEEGLLSATESLSQTVRVHERCGTPVEFQVKPQWFIRLVEHKQAFERRSRELHWAPAHMKSRLDDWIEGLKWDWNISRQRHYGVCFPVWYCRSCGAPTVAERSQLPVDPAVDRPAGACGCGSREFEPERDVMDTWMTSSLTPQINDGWAVDGSDPALVPMSVRVQAFEIIRTWLFYTVVKSEFHFGRLPWRSVMISGWGLNEQGKKISKRDLDRSTTADGFNRYDPDHVIDKYGADALRLWATRSRLGHDLRYNEKDVRTARKFAVKLWNAARFSQGQLGNFDPERATPVPVPERTPVDRWLFERLGQAVEAATRAFASYEYMHAAEAASRLFWDAFCDLYLEMVKDRFLDRERHSDEERLCAQWSLWEALRAILGLYAPFAPFVTEAVHRKIYAESEGGRSLHQSAWPTAPAEWRSDASEVETMILLLQQVRFLRSAHHLHANKRIESVVIDAATQATRELAERIAHPLQTAARADSVTFGEGDRESGVEGIRLAIRV